MRWTGLSPSARQHLAEPHGVDEGTADEREERIVVAFNVMIRGLLDVVMARLELR